MRKKVKSRASFKTSIPTYKDILKEYQIPYLFKSSKLKNLSISEKDLQRRKNLSHLPFITIDGVHAKDFDDAIYVKKIQKGWEVYVSIADVDFYVKEGTSLDREAFERGNSTYFPHFVSPMLPFYLSQDLCSLNPHEKRLTMTVQMSFNSKGFVEKSLIYESVIVNYARLTYEQAQDMIDQKQFWDFSSEVIESLRQASLLARVLFQKRIKSGGLNLNIPETEIHLDSKGNPTDIRQFKRLFSHQVIEEMMLACNQVVGIFLNQKKTPAIYRIHDVPEIEDMIHLKKFIKSIDSSLVQREGVSLSFQQYLSKIIQKTDLHPKKSILHLLILRSLPQACYGAFNRGHFGLNFKFYTHFTSPIRRYSDLVVHRIVKHILGFSKSQQKTQEELEEQAQWVTQCEKRSVQAERKVENIKKAQFMSHYLGEEFQGIISSVTRFGFFVTLKKFNVDGLIHVDSLGGKWNFIPSQVLLRGRTSGYKFSQGDSVWVQVASILSEKGQIDFHLLKHEGKVFKRERTSFRKKKRYSKKTKFRKRLQVRSKHKT